MGVRAAAKTFAICQPEIVSISPAKSEISRLYCLSSEYSNGKKQIKVICNWFKPQSVLNIQVFLGFAKFYQQFT